MAEAMWTFDQPYELGHNDGFAAGALMGTMHAEVPAGHVARTALALAKTCGFWDGTNGDEGVEYCRGFKDGVRDGLKLVGAPAQATA